MKRKLFFMALFVALIGGLSSCYVEEGYGYHRHHYHDHDRDYRYHHHYDDDDHYYGRGDRD